MHHMQEVIDLPLARPARAWPSLRLPPWAVSWLQVGPLALILGVLLAAPIVLFLVVSFFDYDRTGIYPAFIWDNYQELLRSASTLRVYANSLKLAAIVWAITLFLGFNIAYFLIFHVRSGATRAVLFLLCAIPFWTSGIIRTIAWIPFLGRNGAFNNTLMALGITRAPLEFLLFSDFAVNLAYVHLFSLFMVVPIFNTMMRIDRSLIEAAIDAGAGPWSVVKEIVIPLSKSGMAIGSIFVVTLVMGDFITVRLMSGGQSASVGYMIFNAYGAFQYPPAAANAVGSRRSR